MHLKYFVSDHTGVTSEWERRWTLGNFKQKPRSPCPLEDPWKAVSTVTQYAPLLWNHRISAVGRSLDPSSYWMFVLWGLLEDEHGALGLEHFLGWGTSLPPWDTLRYSNRGQDSLPVAMSTDSLGTSSGGHWFCPVEQSKQTQPLCPPFSWPWSSSCISWACSCSAYLSSFLLVSHQTRLLDLCHSGSSPLGKCQSVNV